MKKVLILLTVSLFFIGSAFPPNNEFITIPGIRGAAPREISTKNLAHIIESRMEEILEYVVYHLRQIGLDKKLA